MKKEMAAILTMTISMGSMGEYLERSPSRYGDIVVEIGGEYAVESIGEGIEVDVNKILKGNRVREILEVREERVEDRGPESYRWPIEWDRVTSRWGYRTHPVTGERKMHHGIDLRAEIGTPIHSPSQGRVRFAGWMGGYGMVVILDHAHGYSTRFAHLSGFTVEEGDEVSMGDLIAKSGNSGRSTGPHLHYEIRKDEVSINPMGFRWDEVPEEEYLLAADN